MGFGSYRSGTSQGNEARSSAPSGGRDANDRGNGDGRAAAQAAAAQAAAQQAAQRAAEQRAHAAMLNEAEAQRVATERNVAAQNEIERQRVQELQAARAQQEAQVAAQQEAQRAQRTATERAGGMLTMQRALQGQQYSNGVPVDDLSTYGGQQSPYSRADAAIMGQDFTPQMPNSAGGFMNMAANPFAPFTGSFMDQTRYGMSPASQSIFDGLDPTQRANIGSMQDQVNFARNQVMENQRAPNSYAGPQRPSNFSPQQWNSMTQGQQMYMSGVQTPTNGVGNNEGGVFAGQAGMGGGRDANDRGDSAYQVGLPPTETAGRDYSGGTGTFTPVTFRSGMQEAGSNLMDQAGAMSQRTPEEFNYNFNPEEAGQRLFDQRAALLQPQFAQQNTNAKESMFGGGRLGLQLAGEGLGMGMDTGTANPDALGVANAQSRALAGLAAQSTNDAFGQEQARAGMDLSQFNTNQMAQQQQYANMMGSGQSLFGAGGQIIGQGQKQQALDDSYELGRYNADTSRITGQAQANSANYQPDPWLTGLTSLGTSFLGSSGGSGWLSGLF